MTEQLWLKRVLVGALALILLAIAGVTLFNFASSTTDENVFVTSPSLLVVRHGIPAHWKEPIVLEKLSLKMGSATDSISLGDLVIGVNRDKVMSLTDWGAAFSGPARDTTVLVSVYRPSTRTAGIYVVSRRDIDDGFLHEIDPSVVVTEVTPGGASDRAGLLVGDLIVRINGARFTTDFEADQILQRAQSGKSITYDVYRSDHPLTVNVTLATFGFSLWIAWFCLSGLFMLAFGIFLAFERPGIKAALLLGLSFMLFGFFILLALPRRDVQTPLTMARDVAIYASFVFGWAAVIHSENYFPRERPERIAQPWIHRIGYALAFLLTLATVVIHDVQAQFRIGIMVLLVYSIVTHVLYRKQRTSEQKRITRVISITTIFVVGLLTALGVASYLTGGTYFRYGGILPLLIPLSYLYTIGRYRLLDLNLRIRRNLQYSLLSITLGIGAGIVFMALFSLVLQVNLHIPVVIITGSSIEVTDAPASPEVREVVRRGIAVLVTMLTWYVLWRIRKHLQRRIDEKYYRTRYDYRNATEQLAEVMATKLTMVDLGRGIVDKLASLMHVKRAGILFFRDESICCCQEASGIEGVEWNDFCGAAAIHLAKAIRGFTGEIRVDYLPGDLKSDFLKHGFQYLVPIRSKDQLIGIFILGEKLSESTYSQEDLAFLSAAARQASVAIENAFLYEELAEKERMKHELEIARRIQLASLPQRTPEIPGLDIAGLSLPAHEVGGDFFDYLNGRADNVTIIVGDVSGKGTSAALYMAKVQGILRSLHGFDFSPGPLFIHANRLLCADLEKNSFITAVGAAFNSSRNEIILARAGHLPLYHLIAAQSRVERIVPRGLGLGLNNAQVFLDELEERVVPYGPGDILLFVTDGVTEARNTKGDEFGEDRLLVALESHKNDGATEFRDRLFADLKAFVGDQPPFDDQTIVVVKAI